MSEKSRLVLGRGTVPGSERTALKCDMTIRNIIILKMTTFTAPTRLHRSKPKSKYKPVVHKTLFICLFTANNMHYKIKCNLHIL